MWSRTDLEDGYESNKTGSSGGSPGWTPDSAWSSSISEGRRLSTVSDSGDTGIGTYCSDSVEDDSSCSTTPLSFLPLSQLHLDDDGIPVLSVLPSPSSSPGARLRVPPSPQGSGHWVRTCRDMKDKQPIRRWSSLTKLSSDRRMSGLQSGPKGQGSLDRGLLSGYRKGSNVDLSLPLSSSFISSSLLQCSPGAGPGYRYDRSAPGLDSDPDQYQSDRSTPGLEPDWSLSSPVRYHGALPEAQVCRGRGQVTGQVNSGQVSGLDVPLYPSDRSSPIQSAVRTQMWLTEQMEYRPGLELGTKVFGDGLSPWQPGLQPEPGLNQVLKSSCLPVNTLVKVKEGLLRQRELEIDRQKQQILQLHARIRENELRAQQVLQSQRGWLDDLQVTPSHSSSSPTCTTKPDQIVSLLQDPRMSCKQQQSNRICCDEDLRGKLAVAELEVLHLNEFFKQVTQKYSEDIRKLEEKVKTRDRYISSLKKRCQRETDQNQEKQQRIETLEKYLSDLPTLEEVQVQQQQQQVQQRVEDLQKAMVLLQRSLDEGSRLMEQKELKMEQQNQREKELMSSVHSLQQKVQQCLDDGVRLPVQDLKRLEVENSQLLQLQDHSSRLFNHQREQIDRLTSQLTATSSRLQKHRGVSDGQEAKLPLPPRAFTQEQHPTDGGSLVRPLSQVKMPELGHLLKEMSLCLLDLQGLCSILAQRAQGKEPNLTLLLDMKSLSVSADDSDCEVEVVEEELRFKLLEVGQLRRDIDELRRSISDRYAQFMGDSCVSQ
ncbi:centrosomal protein of 85 kDa-like isoform X3 [Amphiprion ocellaris]|uniref:centrosomal protein of 85 kDa-like isoform X3 n=1 Tax=Amphiprion ocellaris TaxID=80972 RepID=UPI000C2FF3A1|nr:centrosomal protein of 85 kDa-like isoform X3 [Amphiprion ocellaris]